MFKLSIFFLAIALECFADPKAIVRILGISIYIQTGIRLPLVENHWDQ